MNFTSADPTAPPPPPPQQQPPRSSFSCDRHPTEQFNGFCPSCLCERLTTLDNSSSNTPSSSRRPSSASAAIKALFSSVSKTSNFPPQPPLPKPAKPSTSVPGLRRSKSFSASKNEALGLPFEPQRKSCDVRVRNNTLWTLFSLDEGSKAGGSNHNKPYSASTLASSSSTHQNHHSSKKTESCLVFEEIENEKDSGKPQNADVDDGGDEIRPAQDSYLEGLRKSVELNLTSGEIVAEAFDSSNLKPMKDHIDLNSQEKKSSGGGFWSAASVFSKKWQNWRRKHKVKKQSNGETLPTLPVEKPLSRQYRETQSEIADYGFGRRSCDIDPRFSLDAGRISFDGGRYSFDEPRASWDGHLIGRSFPRMAPMLSVMEDAPSVAVPRFDMQIPVEEPTKNCSGDEDEGLPGGLDQTKEYYLDSSSSRRRKSLDRSSSIRKSSASLVDQIDELKDADSSFHGAKVLVDPNPNSLRDDLSETFELREIGNAERKEAKKSRRWSWRIWGFIQRRNGANGTKEDDEEDEKYSRASGVERSLSESWHGDSRGGLKRSMLRSNSSVSCRSGSHIARKPSTMEMYGNAKRRNSKNELVLEKNGGGSGHFDNGFLRFYLAGERVGMGKIKPANSQPIARSVLRLY